MLNRQIFFCLTLLIFASGAVNAQDEPETRNEFWPEIDVFVQINPKIRLLFLGTVSKNRETNEVFEGQVGGHVDYLLNKRVSFRTGYRFGFSIGDTGDPYIEHRILFEQTFRFPVRYGFYLVDRNRQDLRWINKDFSVRYRNRLKLEREFMIRGRSYMPYSLYEIYYDSRHDAWSRNRYAFGVEISLKRHGPLAELLSPRKNVVLDLFYMKMNNTHSQPRHVNIFSIVLNLYY